ncbi:MAG: hypothetical protein ACREOZ_00595, partial [Gloeomargaritales cyanobacterium]
MKVKAFRKEDIPTQRRRKFTDFVHSIIPVLRTDVKTQNILKQWPAKVNTDVGQEGNMAFYSLLHVYVDPHYRMYLQRHQDDGCAAFIALTSHCAQTTSEDKANYSRALLTIMQGPQELAYQYIERFNCALELAITVGNKYENNYIIDLMIQGFGSQAKYACTVSMLKESRRRDEVTGTTTVTLTSIESIFAAIDEYTHRRQNAFNVTNTTSS